MGLQPEITGNPRDTPTFPGLRFNSVDSLLDYTGELAHLSNTMKMSCLFPKVENFIIPGTD